MVQRCKGLPRVMGAEEICHREDGRISGAWDSILREMCGTLDSQNVCPWAQPQTAMVRDCDFHPELTHWGAGI